MANARSGKTISITLGVWFDEQAGDIHLSIPGQGLSTINSNPVSKRGNPHLFNKLAKVLRSEGKPHPQIVEDWSQRIG
ncbi:hypothetical protein [Novosphingobium sp.]|uniref:hypothetical protein n=1 Tax=Novosphingobium sp. TaxID=1874826 RepID=UPI002612BE5B|nr:hypothetical protein [Novosphingobium sp.]